MLANRDGTILSFRAKALGTSLPSIELLVDILIIDRVKLLDSLQNRLRHERSTVRQLATNNLPDHLSLKRKRSVVPQALRLRFLKLRRPNGSGKDSFENPYV